MGIHQLVIMAMQLFFRVCRFLFIDAWPIGIGFIAASLATGQTIGAYSNFGWLIFFICAAAGLILRYSRRHQAEYARWKDYYKLVTHQRFLQKKEVRKNAAV